MLPGMWIAPAHAEAGARLQVGGDQERDVGVRLEVVELGGHVGGRAHRHDDAADALLLDHAHDTLVAGGAGRA